MSREARAAAGGVVHSRVFTLPKAGHAGAEYEDACAWDAGRGAFAVADGAGDSAFAGLWARLLVEQFVQTLPAAGDAGAWRAWIRPAQEEWAATVQAGPLPWYVEAKVREGAFATFVGLILRLDPAGDLHHWAALAVGDSCLFHVPGDGAPGGPAGAGFPLSRPDEFTRHPLALASVAERNEALWPQVAVARGHWRLGDHFVLATDALAQWITREIVPEARWDPFLHFLWTHDDPAFARFAEDQRRCGNLRNDDLTLLLLRTAPPRTED